MYVIPYQLRFVMKDLFRTSPYISLEITILGVTGVTTRETEKKTPQVETKDELFILIHMKLEWLTYELP